MIDNQETDIKKSFWKNLEDLLKSSFSDCATHIGQCLQQDLPKLLAFARGLEVKFGTQFLFRSVFAIRCVSALILYLYFVTVMPFLNL